MCLRDVIMINGPAPFTAESAIVAADILYCE